MSFGPCADHNTTRPYRGTPRQGYCALCARIKKEGKVARRLVRALLAAGYAVSVHDSEEMTVRRSRSERAIMTALFTTDDDRLYATPADAAPGDWSEAGWVWLVYGNSGWDVISDYTTNLEDVLAPVLAYCETLEDR